MALRAGLLGRSLLSCQGLRRAYVSQLRTVSIQARPAELPCEEGHDEKNMRLGRPQSPHLTIYKMQLTSVLSITHRFTGMILSGYATTFAMASLLSNKPMCELITTISTNYPNFFYVFKFGLVFPFTYHFCNGIRHLIWDTGVGLTLKGVYASGYAMLLFFFGSSGYLVYESFQQKRLASEKASLRKKAKPKKGGKGGEGGGGSQQKEKCKKKKAD